MKEGPILMNGAMVRATIDGRKTQTRRIVKGDYIDKSWNVPGFHPRHCPFIVGMNLWVIEFKRV